MVAEQDPDGLRNASVDMLELGRADGARWALTVDADEGHWGYEHSWSVMLAFVEGVFALRVAGDGTLVDLAEREGWCGDLVHKRSWQGDQGHEHVVGAQASPMSAADAASEGSWLLDEAFAQSWLDHHDD